MDEFVSSVFGIAKVDPKSTYQMFLEFSNLKGIDSSHGVEVLVTGNLT